MNSNRSQIQVYFEELFECYDPNNFHSYRDHLSDYSLIHDDISNLKELQREDAKGFLFKGLLSFAQALHDINNGLYSWATIKIYYSIYYMLRTSLLNDNHCLIKNKSTYYLDISIGSKPVKKSQPRFRGDHKSTILIFKEEIGDRDILQTNTINNLNPYLWMMDRREEVNYRNIEFFEPDINPYYQILSERDMEDTLKTIILDDNYTYCFDEDYACLALPLKRMLITLDECNSLELKLKEESYQLIMSLINDLTSNQHLLSSIAKLHDNH